jgi:hypothetical protein
MLACVAFEYVDASFAGKGILEEEGGQFPLVFFEYICVLSCAKQIPASLVSLMACSPIDTSTRFIMSRARSEARAVTILSLSA